MITKQPMDWVRPAVPKGGWVATGLEASSYGIFREGLSAGESRIKRALTLLWYHPAARSQVAIAVVNSTITQPDARCVQNLIHLPDDDGEVIRFIMGSSGYGILCLPRKVAGSSRAMPYAQSTVAFGQLSAARQRPLVAATLDGCCALRSGRFQRFLSRTAFDRWHPTLIRPFRQIRLTLPQYSGYDDQAYVQN